jgi:hypothetical protein
MTTGNEGSGMCGDSTGSVDPIILSEPCESGSVEVVLPPGTHWWYAAAQATSNTTCGEDALYNATLECSAYSCPDTCDEAMVIERLPFTTRRPTRDVCSDYYYEDCRIDSFLDYPGSPDAVYKYTPPGDHPVDIDLCDAGFQASLYVYENTCPLAELNKTEPDNAEYACTEYPSGCPSASQAGIFNLMLTGGNDYYIVVDGSPSGGDSGDYLLEMTRLPGECDEINGPIDGFGTIGSQQCEATQTYIAVADDFYLDAEGEENACIIDFLDIGITHFFHAAGCVQGGGGTCYDSPLDYDGIRVAIYADAAGVPAGHPNDDGTQTDALYDLTLTTGYTGYPEDWTTLWTTWLVSIDLRPAHSGTTVELEKNTTYWLSVAPQVCRDDYYVAGAAFSNTITNTRALVWDAGAWVWEDYFLPDDPWPDQDWSFMLLGHKGGTGCDSEADPDQWCIENAGTGRCHRNICDPQAGNADANGCVCNPIVGGDVYPVPDGDMVSEGFDLLCILDAANSDNTWGCLETLPTGYLAGDIWPCDGLDMVVEGFDILSVLDSNNGEDPYPDSFACPNICTCP